MFSQQILFRLRGIHRSLPLPVGVSQLLLDQKLDIRLQKYSSQNIYSLKQVLNLNPESVLDALCLQKNDTLSNVDHIRIGSKGSLCVNLDQGIWFNFETDKGGDMLQLIKECKQITDYNAVEFAQLYILPKISGDHINKIVQKSDDEKGIKRKASIEKYIEELMKNVLPLEDTIAADYLRIHRNIYDLPQKNLLFHPNLKCMSKHGQYLENIPGMIAIASHPNSSAINLQITYLDPETKTKHAEVAIAKQTFGSFLNQGCFHYCELSDKDPDRFSIIAEGVETALSLYQVFPFDHIIATLGKSNIKRVDPSQLNQKVLLVLDNDGQDLLSDKTFISATSNLTNHGKSVYVVFPQRIKDLEKTDLNDILIHEGTSGVSKAVKSMLKFKK